MHFAIDIDLDAVTGSPEEEVGRILRYWAGALKQMQLGAGTELELMDSTYTPVGHLRVTDAAAG
jgi:hypothetical protein